jgi:hypothetical protein
LPDAVKHFALAAFHVGLHETHVRQANFDCCAVPENGGQPLRFPDAKRYGVICSAFFFAAS